MRFPILLALLAMLSATQAFLLPPQLHAPKSTGTCASSTSLGAGLMDKYGEFRQWQLDESVRKAKSNEKWEETVQGIMSVEGWSREEAEKKAVLAINDPLGYMVAQTDAKAKKTGKPKDYRKIDGFFPMEWLLSGDFGWGYNKKARREREAREAAAKNAKK